MGDCAIENGNKKRVRDCLGELESESPELKRVNTSTCSHPTPSESNRDEPESERNSPESTGSEARMIREDILDIFDDTETVPATQDLDSVIRSFEEEILHASPSAAQPAVVKLMSDSGDSQPDLGYLLEASDDELGLPPTATPSEVQPQEEPIDTSLGNAEVLVGLRSMAGFEDDLQSYDTFGLGLAEKPIGGGGGDGDFVTVDGLFDYTEPSDFSDLAWRPESLPAL